MYIYLTVPSTNENMNVRYSTRVIRVRVGYSTRIIRVRITIA